MAVVGLMMAVAVVSSFVYYVLAADNLVRRSGLVGTEDLKELPGPRGLGPLGPPIVPTAPDGGAS